MGVPYITTDGMIDLMALRVCDLTADKIADGLAKVNRFNGRTPAPYSVAAHSVVVAMVLPSGMKAHGALHDAHEFLLGDMATPSVEYIAAPFRTVMSDVVTDAVMRAKHQIDCAVHNVWGLKSDLDLAPLWRADNIVCLAEMHLFFDAPAVTGPDKDLFDEAVDLTRQMPQDTAWREARELWLQYVIALSQTDQLTLPSFDQRSAMTPLG